MCEKLHCGFEDSIALNPHALVSHQAHPNRRFFTSIHASPQRSTHQPPPII